MLWTRWGQILIILVASAVLFSQAGRDVRLHPDEAFFLTFARSAAVQGDWWLQGDLDKPPLSLYLHTLGLSAWGVTINADAVLDLHPRTGEWSARITSVWLTLMGLALLMRWATDLMRSTTAGILAGGLMILSPFTQALGPAVFTDMPALSAVLAGVVCVRAGRAGLAGLLFAAAAAIRPHALLMLPWAWVAGGPGVHPIRFGAGLLAGLGIMLGWDVARPGTSIFALGIANNIRPEDWTLPDIMDRLSRWWGYISLLTPHPLLTLALVGGWAWAGWRQTWVLWLGLWAVGYSALYIITPLNAYDRYVLPLLPLLVTGSVAGWRFIWQRWPAGLWPAIALSIVLATSSTPLPSHTARLQRTGIDTFARQLAELPVATVLYDRWLGWELGYYLGAWHDKRRVYFPTPEALACGALALSEAGIRYLLVPPWEDDTPYLIALEKAGFDITDGLTSQGYTARAIIPPWGEAAADAGASWRDQAGCAG